MSKKERKKEKKKTGEKGEEKADKIVSRDAGYIYHLAVAVALESPITVSLVISALY